MPSASSDCGQLETIDLTSPAGEEEEEGPELATAGVLAPPTVAVQVPAPPPDNAGGPSGGNSTDGGVVAGGVLGPGGCCIVGGGGGGGGGGGTLGGASDPRKPVTAQERQREREEKRRRRQERARERERRQKERERKEGGGRRAGGDSLGGVILSEDDRNLLERWRKMMDGGSSSREQGGGAKEPKGAAAAPPSNPQATPTPVSANQELLELQGLLSNGVPLAKPARLSVVGFQEKRSTAAGPGLSLGAGVSTLPMTSALNSGQPATVHPTEPQTQNLVHYFPSQAPQSNFLNQAAQPGPVLAPGTGACSENRSDKVPQPSEFQRNPPLFAPSFTPLPAWARTPPKQPNLIGPPQNRPQIETFGAPPTPTITQQGQLNPGMFPGKAPGLAAREGLGLGNAVGMGFLNGHAPKFPPPGYSSTPHGVFERKHP
ncbi:UNVERIFIED_CONTAM: hypothetical protein FKN15_068935 [Acipenser sinensis]